MRAVCDLYRAEVEYGGSTHTLDIVDTWGAEHTNLVDEHLKGANVAPPRRDMCAECVQGVMIVFDVTSKASFDQVPELHAKVRHSARCVSVFNSL